MHDVQFDSVTEHVKQLLVHNWHWLLIPMYEILEQVSTHLLSISKK
jgi:hypothetical protein